MWDLSGSSRVICLVHDLFTLNYREEYPATSETLLENDETLCKPLATTLRKIYVLFNDEAVGMTGMVQTNSCLHRTCTPILIHIWASRTDSKCAGADTTHTHTHTSPHTSVPSWPAHIHTQHISSGKTKWAHKHKVMHDGILRAPQTQSLQSSRS